jgi:hypothetical protein
MLSVKGEVVDTDGGVPQFSLLWTSPEFVDETGGDVLSKKLRLTDKIPSVVWTSLGPLPLWVPGPTTRWAPGTTRLVPHGT